MKKILEKTINENGFGCFHFNIEENTKSLDFVLDGSLSFISLIIYDSLGNLVGQIVTNSAAKRRLNRKMSLSSPGFKELKNFGLYRVDYIYYSGQEKNLSFEVYSMEVFEEEKDEMDLSQKQLVKDIKGWYKGDFHTHTIYSDGKMTREDNNKKAKEQGLDFFAPTDHNFNHFSWPKTDDLLIIASSEITSEFGHVNVFFEDRSIFEDFSLKDLLREEDFSKILQALEGRVFAINHPFMSQWKFTVKNFDLKNLKFMEIINDPTYKDSKKASQDAIKAWNILLDNGYKVFGIGGSDSHLLPNESYENSSSPSLIGDPKTYIYSKELSTDKIRESMLEGKISVSRNKLLEIKREGNIFRSFCQDESFLGKKLYSHWIFDSNTIKIDPSTSSSLEIEVDDKYHWLRVDLLDEDGNLFAFTNPIFFNPEKSKSEIFIWQELMEKVYND